MSAVDPRADGVVLLLGDQPGVQADVVTRLIDDAGASPIGVCRYADGLGHPFWFDRDLFAELHALHGDKAVWKLLHSARFAVREISVDTQVPIDVDTWDDYRAPAGQGGAMTRRSPTPPTSNAASTRSTTWSTRAWRRRCSSP